MPFISKTPKPPYYAVVFTSINADVDHTEHRETQYCARRREFMTP
jgi:hypothetical protein